MECISKSPPDFQMYMHKNYDRCLKSESYLPIFKFHIALALNYPRGGCVCCYNLFFMLLYIPVVIIINDVIVV